MTRSPQKINETIPLRSICPKDRLRSLEVGGGSLRGIGGTTRQPHVAASCRHVMKGVSNMINPVPPCLLSLNKRSHVGRHRRMILSLVSAAVLSVCANSAWSQDKVSETGKPTGNWQVALGAGALVAPEYEGSDELTVDPIPYFSISWNDRIFLNLERGLGVYAYRDDRFRLGVSVGYAQGRDQDDSDRLRGLGDIDAAARGQVFARYSLGQVNLGLDLTQDFGGTDGFQVRPSVGLDYTLTEKVKLSPEVSATWASDDYMQSYFGISPTQASRSALRRHDAEAGFKRADLKVAATWSMTSKWFTTAKAGVGYLMGDAADSPITDRRIQPSAGLFVGYKF